jgi:hypothetical protein
MDTDWVLGYGDGLPGHGSVAAAAHRLEGVEGRDHYWCVFRFLDHPSSLALRVLPQNQIKDTI